MEGYQLHKNTSFKQYHVKEANFVNFMLRRRFKIEEIFDIIKKKKEDIKLYEKMGF